MSVGQLIARAGESGALVLRAANVVAFTPPTDPAEQPLATVDFGDGDYAVIPTLTTGLVVNRVCAVLIEKGGSAIIIGQYGRDGSMAVEGYDIPPGGTKGQVLAKASAADGHMTWVDPQTGPQGPPGPAGVDGVDGVDGKDGAQGPPGPVHPGGLTGQVLTKMADGDGEVDWQDPQGGGGAGLVDLPLGAVTSFAGTTAPDGWLLCDGSLVSRTVYRDLFAVIGTKYGAGDGTTTFALPDMRDRFAVGASATKALAAKGGAETHTLTTAEMPAHSHGGATGWMDRNASHAHGLNRSAYPYADSGAIRAGDFNRGTAGSDTETHGVTTGLTDTNHLHSIAAEGGGAAHNNMPPYVALTYIIRATPKLSGITIQTGDPVGTIHVWPSASPAQGFRLCDGSTVAKADVDVPSWNALAAALGADPAGATITLPDLRDRFVYGAGTTALGTKGGVATSPAHTHSSGTLAAAVGSIGSNAGWLGLRIVSPPAGASGTSTNVINGANADAGGANQGMWYTDVEGVTGDGGGGDNMPPYIALSYVIRVQRSLVVADGSAIIYGEARF